MTKILMCRPDFFGIEYEINPWMHKTNPVDRDEAIEQWTDLFEALTDVASVSLIEPVEGLPDMVFTANAGLVLRDRYRFISSNFHFTERKYEEEYFRRWFYDRGYMVSYQNSVDFEGEGDCLWDGQIHWFGYGFRSEYDARKHIGDYPSNSLRLVDKRFYHLDTCFCPLSSDSVLFYPGAFDRGSRELIRMLFDNVIEVTEEEALTFACNAVIVDNRYVFMPVTTDRVVREIVKLGFMVSQFDMSEFMKSGGACKCLTLMLET